MIYYFQIRQIVTNLVSLTFDQTQMQNNMKSKHLIYLGLLQFIFSGFLPAQTYFQKKYGLSHLMSGNNIVQTPDQKLIVACRDILTSTEHPALLITNSDGSVSGYLRFSGCPGNAEFYDVINCRTGGFISAGYTETVNGDYDFLVVKSDSSGIVQWAKSLGSATDEYCFRITETQNGEIILAGKTTLPSSGIYTAPCLMKISAAGNLIWARNFATPNVDFDELTNLITDSAGTIYAAGSISNNYKNSLLMCLNPAGDTLWTRIMHLSFHSIVIHMAMTQDNHLMIIGRYLNNGVQGYRIYALKYTTTGSMVWVKGFTTPNAYIVPTNAIQTSDWSYIISGLIDSLNPQFPFMIKIDSAGNLIGGNEFLYSTLFYLRNGTKLPDETFAFTGGEDEFLSPNAFILKTDASGNTPGCAGNPVSVSTEILNLALMSTPITITSIFNTTNLNLSSTNLSIGDSSFCPTVGIEKISEYTSFEIFPNPAKRHVLISFSGQHPEAIRICDINGKALKEIQPSSSGFVDIQLNDFAAGLYLVQTIKGGVISSKKLVLE